MKITAKILIIFTLIICANCAYYNTFFNTKKFFDEAEKEREQEWKKNKARRNNNKVSKNRNRTGTDNRNIENEIPASARQKYTKAIEKASRLLEYYPESKYVDDAVLIMGISFFYQTEYRKAKRKFEELLTNFPESEFAPEAQLWLGKTNIYLRDYDTAEQNFKSIVNSQAKDRFKDEAQFLLGGLYFHKEDYTTALEGYKVAAENTKEKTIKAEAYFQMGECYIFLKNFEGAAESFDKARKYSPDPEFEYQALFKAGLAQKDLQRYDAAIKLFKNILGDISTEDYWPDCKIEIAECLYAKGEINDAIAWYEEIVEQHKRTEAAAKAYYNLGLIYQKHNSDYEQAKEYYDLAVKENSSSDAAYDAKAISKSVENLLKLRKDIIEQEKRIAKGDSVAAVITDDEEEEKEEDKYLIKEFAELDSLVYFALQLPEDSLMAYHDSLMTYYDVHYKDYEHQQKSILATEPKFTILDTLVATALEIPLNFLEDYQDSLKNVYDRYYPIYKKNKQVYDLHAQNLDIALKKEGNIGTPEEELIKDKMMLAEIYLFDFNQPDSALKEYHFVLQRDTTEEIPSKAIYSIGYIYEYYFKDTLAADSAYKKLLELYPESTYAERIRKKYDIQNDKAIEDIVLEEFKQAENAYLDYANYDAAIQKYEQLAANYPETPFASKALLSVGWIYENYLKENDKAIKAYEKLIEKYPETDHAKQIKKKIDTVNRQRELLKQGKSIFDEAVKTDQSAEVALAGENDYEINDIIKSEKQRLRDLLKAEMDKDRSRLRNPERIIKSN